MARRVKCKLCIGCGKVMPARPTDKGWTITQIAAKGYGQRWYRQCGCMAPVAYGAMVDDLFHARRDLPHRFPAAGVVEVPETSQVEGE